MIKDIKNLCEKKHYPLLIFLFCGLIIATLFELIGLGSLPLFAMLILDVQVLADNLPNFINKEKLSKYITYSNSSIKVAMNKLNLTVSNQ